MTRLFLTGGTGFFGKSILDMLKNGYKNDTQFVILSRNPQKFLAENPGYAALDNVRFVAGDVRDFAFFDEKFERKNRHQRRRNSVAFLSLCR